MFEGANSLVDLDDWQRGKGHDNRKALDEQVRISNDDYFAELSVATNGGSKYKLNDLSEKADDRIVPTAWYRRMAINGSHLTYKQIFESRVGEIVIGEVDGNTTVDFKSKAKDFGEKTFEISFVFDSYRRLVLATYKNLDSPNEKGEYSFRYDLRYPIPSFCNFLGTSGGKRFSRSWYVRNIQLGPVQDKAIFRLPYYGIPEPKKYSRWPIFLPLAFVAFGILIVLISSRFRGKQ